MKPQTSVAPETDLSRKRHMHPKPNSPFPWPCRIRVCQAGIRAQVAAVVTVLAALMVLSYLAPSAEARETPVVEVGEGTVRVGDDVFAGDGCARVGDVVAGDCGESSETQQGDEPAGDKREEKTEQEEPKTDEEKPSDDDSGGTTIREETTDPETTGAGRGEGGTTSFFGGTTPAGATAEDIEACPTAPPDDAAPATVERAVDGDTVELQKPVDGYDKVRLIGVNTPEMEGEDGSPEPGAEKASEFTADALEGEEVVLETDEEVESRKPRSQRSTCSKPPRSASRLPAS